MITILTASAAATITNRFVDGSRAERANFGAGVFAEAFWWVDRLSGSSVEEGRILLKVPLDSWDAALASSLWLKLRAAPSESPSDFTIDVHLLTGSFEPGSGIDDLYGQEGNVSWLSGTSPWTLAGGNALSLPTASQAFRGTEDLEVDVTSMIAFWTGSLGLSDPVQFLLKMRTGSVSVSYPTKKFWSCALDHADMRPAVHLRTLSAEASDERVLAAGETAKFSILFKSAGYPADIDGLMAKIQDADDVLKYGPVATSRLRSGSYQFSVAADGANGLGAGSVARVVWLSGTGVNVSGSLFTVGSRFASSAPSFARGVLSLGSGWGGEFSLGDAADLSVSWFDEPLPQTYFLTASTALTTRLPKRGVRYRLRNLNREDLVYDFCAESTLPYGEDRCWVELRTQGLEPGASYQVEFELREGSSRRVVVPAGATFKIRE